MNTEEHMASVRELLKTGDVGFYGCSRRDIPTSVLETKTEGSVSVFVKTTRVSEYSGGEVTPRTYETLLDIVQEDLDACFLDRDAVKMLAARFPQKPRYVLVRITPRFSWLVGVPGLIRRLVKGHVKFRGVIRIPVDKGSRRWLVLERQATESSVSFSLDSEAGVEGLLKYLNNSDIRYAVLRFYQRLPNLYREGGDLDLLVADDDEEKVVAFLRSNPGSIGVDVHSVSSRNTGGLPYYPPPLARRILDRAVTGPAGARIPDPEDAFLSFAYHALYHKGVRAGIPSTIPAVEVFAHPENDYAGILSDMAERLGIKVQITMEDLDDYLARRGWRPKLDTLAKISLRNEWVRARFFSEGSESKDPGLGVVVLKEKAVRLGMVEQITSSLEEEGFTILETRYIREDEKQYIADHLRGGNWASSLDAQEDLLPAVVIAVLDLRAAHLPFEDDTEGGGRLRRTKRKLRSRFDEKGRESMIHSTDNTNEAREYIELCFPERTKEIGEKATRISQTHTLPLHERVFLYLRALPRLLVRSTVRRILE